MGSDYELFLINRYVINRLLNIKIKIIKYITLAIFIITILVSLEDYYTSLQ